MIMKIMHANLFMQAVGKTNDYCKVRFRHQRHPRRDRRYLGKLWQYTSSTYCSWTLWVPWNVNDGQHTQHNWSEIDSSLWNMWTIFCKSNTFFLMPTDQKKEPFFFAKLNSHREWNGTQFLSSFQAGKRLQSNWILMLKTQPLRGFPRPPAAL